MCAKTLDNCAHCSSCVVAANLASGICAHVVGVCKCYSYMCIHLSHASFEAVKLSVVDA